MSSAIRKIKNKREEVELREILKDKKKRARLFLLLSGIIFLFIGFYLSKSSTSSISSSIERQVSSDVISFSQEPVKVDNSLLSKQTKIDKTKNPPIRIIIPALDIDIPVREAKVIKGYWEVFPDVAGFGLGSSYPDEVGNQVIFAHARSGLFLSLKKAKVGQNIYIFTSQKWYQYKVVDVKEVLPSQTEVIGPSGETILTLYTCSGYADSKRLIVVAKRI